MLETELSKNALPKKLPYSRKIPSGSIHGSLALDGALVQKISKRLFFQYIKKSFHKVTQLSLEPHQNFFQKIFSTNMVARGVQRFCILEGATDPLIEQ